MRIQVVLFFAIVHCVWFTVGTRLPIPDGKLIEMN